MTFAHPLWIVAGIVVCLGSLLLFRRLQAQRLATLEKFAAARLLGRLTRNVSAGRQWAKKILFMLALFCSFLALARPQYGFNWEEVKRKGIDILFAVDTSKSMLAGDMKPNRLERAKLAIMDFVDQLDGDRVGLLPFAGSAFLMCPLTGDYQAFESSLQAVDTAIIPKGGTDIAAAIREAESVLSNEANYKLLVLITDGENLEGDVLKAAQEAAKKGVRIFPVGVGTKEGEIIPVSEGAQGFVKDASGQFVVSRLDAATLTQVAEKSNGLYAPLGNKGQGLQTIYQEKLSLVPKEALTERRHKVPIERFQWPLAGALCFLVLDFMIGTRKSRPLRWPFKKKKEEQRSTRNIVGTLLLFAIMSGFPLSATTSRASEGETAYQKKAYPQALEQYRQLVKKHPDDPKLQFNFGTAAYQNKQFDQALAAFDAALASNDLDLQERAYYNRGNAYCKKGEETLQSDPQQTRVQWQKAVASYAASLELKPDDQDAVYNRDLVQKKLDVLKENEPKKQQQDRDRKPEANEKKGPKDQQDKPQEGQQGQDPEASPSPQKSDSAPKGDHGDGEKQDGSVQPEQDKPQKDAAARAREAKKAADKAGAEAGFDTERRKEGKMTREDADQLLHSLKNEEGKVLNFVPTGGKGSDDEPRRDW